MYAVLEIAGEQVKVEKGERIRVPRLKLEPSEKVQFSEVFLVSKDGEILVGEPTVEGARVEARVISHGRGDKVTVFKMKRRKKYRRKTGHRQGFTELLIEDIIIDGETVAEENSPHQAGGGRDQSPMTNHQHKE